MKGNKAMTDLKKTHKTQGYCIYDDSGTWCVVIAEDEIEANRQWAIMCDGLYPDSDSTFFDDFEKSVSEDDIMYEQSFRVTGLDGYAPGIWKQGEVLVAPFDQIAQLSPLSEDDGGGSYNIFESAEAMAVFKEGGWECLLVKVWDAVIDSVDDAFDFCEELIVAALEKPMAMRPTPEQIEELSMHAKRLGVYDD